MAMVWYKVWRESQVRFFIGVGVIVALCLMDVLLARRLMPALIREQPIVHTYAQYIYWKVFGGAVRGVTQLLCLLLGLGGLQRDRKQGTLGATLALPVSRTRLIAARAVVGMAEVAALTLLPVVVLWAGSMLVGEQFSPAQSLPFVPLWFAGGMLTFSISFLSSVIFQSEYTALATAYVAYVFYLAGTHHPKLRIYPLNVGDLMNGWLGHFINPQTLGWSGTMPMAILCGFVAAALCLFVTAAWITSRQDL
jgi:ABC-2 type transport system permease protein